VKRARFAAAYTRLDYTLNISRILEVKITVSYYEKIVVTQGITEVWRYEKLNVKGGGARDGDGRDTEHNYRQQQRRRRNTIRQLICTNFDSGSKFVTLTFDNDRDHDYKDVQACNAYFKKFVMRMKYRFPEFKYVAVIEFQDKNGRGAVHYHMICNLPFMKKSELAEIWAGGFVKINRIDKVDNVGAYVIKYMTSDMDDRRLCGENAYLHSRGLEKPVEVTTWRESDRECWRDLHDALEKATPSYSAKYESEAAGHIEYLQYNSNRTASIAKNPE
jgi:hypothetical protein